MSYAMCSKFESTFTYFKAINPAATPSVSLVRKVTSQNRVTDGKCPAVFEQRQASLILRGILAEYGYAMHDEMHFISGVKFSTQTGDIMGLENDVHDLKTVLHRLLSPTAGKTEKAKKVNQWLILSFGTSGIKS